MSEIKQGYHIRRNNPDIKSSENDIVEKLYPSGWVPFAMNIIIFILIMVFGILFSNKSIIKWYDVWTIGATTMICYNLFWWMGRKEFLTNLRYSMHTLAKSIRIKNAIEKIDYKNLFIKKNFDSHEEFKKYVNERLFFTRIPFFCSWVISLINLFVSVVVMLVLRYT